MPISAVFFDVGNTLVHMDYRRVARVINRDLVRPVDAGDLEVAAYAAREVLERAVADGASSEAERHGIFLGALLEAAGVEADAVSLARSRIRAEHQREHLYSVVLPGTAETLGALRSNGLVVGAISNSDGRVEELLEQVGLLQWLDFVIDSGRVGLEKPDPRIFQLGLGQARVQASDALYVGDFYAVDVLGARAAGLRAVLLDPLGRYGHKGCATARDVNEIPVLVSALRIG